MISPSCKHRILLTGASGLLGAAVTAELKPAHEIICVCCRNRKSGMLQCDLTDDASFPLLEKEDWDIIVNLAAHRSPDFCEINRDAASLLNTRTAGRLAQLASQRGARMVHISTDYVFNGENPPYRENAPCSPVNWYGRTKEQAEQQVLAACSNAVVLRIPALYGAPQPPVASTLVEDAVAAAVSATVSFQDNVIVRHPTLTDDIARVISFLLQASFTGILHASAHQKATRYEFARDVAQLLGMETGHIRPSEKDPDRIAVRPIDSHLDTQLLESLGGPVPRPYSEHLPALVKRRKEGAK